MPTSTINASSSPAAGSLNKLSPFIGAVEDQWEMYSDNPSDYTIGSPIGFGASSIVYAAEYQPSDRPPPPIPCALKVLDLDTLSPRPLALLQRETILMSLSKHPNVLRVRGSWMDGHKLYIAMRLMNQGSAADVMRYGWQGGLEEEVIRCILKQALRGLNYLHVNGFIHRDVKAANLLIDDDGTVLLGDLGVAADLSEDTSENTDQSVPPPTILSEISPSQDNPTSTSSNSSPRAAVVESDISVRPKMGRRKSFVGTPCWMSPELIQGKHYDFAADIWSFGITALELSLGRPPRSRESPQKVLLRTIQEAAPTLDREGGEYKYSKAFQEFVASCLIKDPSKRPTAEQLLQSSFLKGAKKPSYLISKILKDLPPLAQRQERRVLPSSQTRLSVDSWDFAATVQAPPLNCSTKTLSQDSGEAVSNVVESIFEVDLNDDSTSSRPHSRSVSFARQSPVIEDEEDLSDISSSSPTPSHAPSTSDIHATDEGVSSSPSSVHIAPLSGVSLDGTLSDTVLKRSRTDTKRISSSVDASRRLLPKLSSSPLQGSSLWARIKPRSSRAQDEPVS